MPTKYPTNFNNPALAFYYNNLKPLSSEPIPSMTSSTKIFANAPALTVKVQITVRNGTMTLTYDGTTPTSTVGHDFVTGTYDFNFDAPNLIAIKAISSSATGYITYFGQAT